MMRAGPALALVAGLALAACGGPQSAFNAHGASAEHLKALIVVTVGICSVVWTAVIVVLIWALTRRRPADSAPGDARRRHLTAAVASATGATVLVIAGLTFASFKATRAVSAEGAADLTIKVRGAQWWWDVRYVDADPARSFTTANEIRIPIGKTVRFELESADVIHSFWVPSLAGKLDLIPGRTNVLTLRADRTGAYRGQCAEFCGLQHSHMAMLIIAMQETEFARWREAQARDAAMPEPAEARAGAAVFMAKPCAGCHTIRGTTAAGTNGPDLTHLADRRNIAAGLFESTRGTMAAWIADPQTLKPGNNMPLVALTADELQQVSAYMMSLK